MFDNVIVGVDDYEGGRDALELAKALVSGDGRITLLYVEVSQREAAAGSAARSVAERQQFGLERLERLRDEAQVAAEVARTQAPSARQGLHEFATDRAADLIVISASRRNQLAHMVLGDDVREVLEDPPCGVAVTPIGYSASFAEMKKIGIAYDGTPESDRALAVARKLATERHATLSAFEAVPPPVYVGDYWNLERDMEEEIEAARQQLAALGDLEPRAEFADDPVEALKRYGASVDLLVIGSHKYRAPDDRLHRSTAQHIADAPGSPLLVLPSASSDGSDGADDEIT